MSGDHVTGDEVSKPWIAEGLRSGSANANHRERSEHGSEVLRRSCRDPRAAERDACDSIPRVAGFQPCEPYPESEIPMEFHDRWMFFRHDLADGNAVA